MRSLPKLILALACVSFLAITLSGFHLHADVDGHDAGSLHADDLHRVVEHDSDHEIDHIDVSIFEPATGFSKVDAIAPVMAAPELFAASHAKVIWSKSASDVVRWHYSRIRPAPRGPPAST
ncbi:MAG: hypothetical protein OEV58_15925 [Gammaproteobacteria bacterium]|nr:hypothetical protein [Gammaproteobacteria bacterium]